MYGAPTLSRRRALLVAGGVAALPGFARAAKPSQQRVLSFRLQNGYYRSAGGPDQTFCSLYQLESPASRVRLLWFNDLKEPITIDAAAVASTSGQDGALSPLDDTGAVDPGLWRAVTFGDAAPDTPAGPLTIPANPGSGGQPLIRVSDWIDVPSLARRDRGAGAFLLVRCYSRGKIRFSAGGPPDPALDRLYRAAWTSGNAAAPPYAMRFVNDVPDLHACYGLQYTSVAPGSTVIGIGDSIMESLKTTGGTSGFGVRACAMVSTPQRPVSYVNEGYSGRRSADFAIDGLRDVALLRPQAALIQAWSENDPWTENAADAAFSLAMRVVDATRQAGGIPVLVTAAPVFSRYPAAEVFRRRSNAAVRAMAGPSLPVLDLDAIWGTGANPNAYRPEYEAGDRTHPNDAGATAAAIALSLVLRKILA